jgi:hypothetical protein
MDARGDEVLIGAGMCCLETVSPHFGMKSPLDEEEITSLQDK